MPTPNPDIIRWARETAGLTLEAAAEHIGLGVARGQSGEQRLAAFETGHATPSRAQLLKMAKQYRRPLLTFYLSEPPQAGDRGGDFRTLPPEYSQADQALLDALIRDIRARQEIARALIEDDDQAEPLSFVSSMSMDDGVDAVLSSITEVLRLDVRQYRRHELSSGSTSGFSYLRRQAEEAGVFVLLLGNLGSHHTNLDTDAFRGFAIADPYAPFVVVNDQDHEAAWAFTLLHELSHLWLGATGVSGADVGSRIERFCNDVAGRFFIVAEEVDALNALRGLGYDALLAEIAKLSKHWQVSNTMIAYKLLQEGIIDHATWARMYALFRERWLAARRSRRERQKDHEGGPNYYVVKRHRLGRALLTLAAGALAEGSLSPTRAGKLLGVKPSRVYGLFEANGQAA